MPAIRKAISETSTATISFFLANGPAVAESSNQSGEGDPAQRDRALIEADLVDCMVALPGQLFYSTQIPAAYGSVGKMKPLVYVATRLNSNSP